MTPLKTTARVSEFFKGNCIANHVLPLYLCGDIGWSVSGETLIECLNDRGVWSVNRRFPLSQLPAMVAVLTLIQNDDADEPSQCT